MKSTHLLAAAALLSAVSAHAQQTATDHAAHHPAQAASAPAAAPQSEGEVRKIDLEQGKITLRHGPLVNLDMPAMTMVFTATDKQLLAGLKAGDKVRFTADKHNGVYMVSAIERAQ